MLIEYESIHMILQIENGITVGNEFIIIEHVETGLPPGPGLIAAIDVQIRERQRAENLPGFEFIIQHSITAQPEAV